MKIQGEQILFFQMHTVRESTYQELASTYDGMTYSSYYLAQTCLPIKRSPPHFCFLHSHPEVHRHPKQTLRTGESKTVHENTFTHCFLARVESSRPKKSSLNCLNKTCWDVGTIPKFCKLKQYRCIIFTVYFLKASSNHLQSDIFIPYSTCFSPPSPPEEVISCYRKPWGNTCFHLHETQVTSSESCTSWHKGTASTVLWHDSRWVESILSDGYKERVCTWITSLHFYPTAYLHSYRGRREHCSKRLLQEASRLAPQFTFTHDVHGVFTCNLNPKRTHLLWPKIR